MIDPDAIQIQNNSLTNEIKIINVCDFECEVYDLNDDKDFERYIKDIKKYIRKSTEYRNYIHYLHDYMGMDRCAFINGVSNSESYDIKIEIHHYPFTLEDITRIVYRKRAANSESLSPFMVAKEVMELHYKSLVGLVPLSETVHELAHNGKIFIPTNIVFGRYNLFIDYYSPYIDPELIDSIERAEKYTIENSEILNTTIIETNKVKYNITDKRYIMPELPNISDKMIAQIEAIKNNNYMLPRPNDEIENKPINPLIFL